MRLKLARTVGINILGKYKLRFLWIGYAITNWFLWIIYLFSGSGFHNRGETKYLLFFILSKISPIVLSLYLSFKPATTEKGFQARKEAISIYKISLMQFLAVALSVTIIYLDGLNEYDLKFLARLFSIAFHSISLLVFLVFPVIKMSSEDIMECLSIQAVGETQSYDQVIWSELHYFNYFQFCISWWTKVTRFT